MFKKEAYFYDFFHEDKDYHQQALEIRKLYPKVKTILELGSGTGLMTKELIKMGFKVDALEPSPEMYNIALQKHRISSTNLFPLTIQNLYSSKKYDLVLALYDVLNYVSFKDFSKVYKKVNILGKTTIIELWNKNISVKALTYKYVKGIHRFRLGFKFKNKAYLWYLYLGKGFCIEFHKLYLHNT